MNILFLYPQYPDSFWSFKHALKFISKEAAVPPLGLITVSAMLPEKWNRRLIDMNVSNLNSEDLKWADYVFISAMYIQKPSVNHIIEECQKHGAKMVAGGPLFTLEYESFPQIDYFVLNEAELTLPLFLKDLAAGSPKRVYRTNEFADLSVSPVPDFQLLEKKKYAFMNIQVTRGCPYNCDFCEITSLLGHKVRMKRTHQIIKELDALYALGWRGSVSVVDDNFIGNKKEIKHELLPAMKNWMEVHKFPFVFNIQSSIDLADDEELMFLMAETGFTSTFVGIETPDEISLQYCHKVQNKNRNLLESVRKIQRKGIQVSGGFIVGFDSDTPDVFERQIEFIQKSGIVSAMVGLLNAPRNTRLYQQMLEQKRLTTDATGNNTDFSMNFKPKMNYDELMNGYRRIIQNIYSIKPYYQRLRQLLLNYNPAYKKQPGINFTLLMAFFKSVYFIGIKNKGRKEYWKMLLWTLFKRPALIADAITYAVYGYHFRIIFGVNSVDVSSDSR